MKTDAQSRMIIALDLPDRKAVLDAVDILAGHVGYFKLGLEIFVAEGPALVEELCGQGHRIFLDLKLHDIPKTVAGAVKSACRMGIHMLTLHAAGGVKMLEAARDAAEISASPPMLLAVTALTSLSAEDVRKIGIQDKLPAWVERLAKIAREAGIQALVASPLELPLLRRRFGNEVKLVAPGIRPAGAPIQNQVRFAEPAGAILAGADFIVIGRPILGAPDPARAAGEIAAEIQAAIEQLK